MPHLAAIIPHLVSPPRNMAGFGMDHSTPQNILIAGAGALGCVFGGFLAQAGHRVTLIGRPWMMDAVRQNGLTIDGLWGSHHITGMHTELDSGPSPAPYDYILLCVKSWDSASMAATMAPHLKPDGVMVSLQNGLGNVEVIQERVGVERSAGARVIFGAEITSPGQVAVTVYAAPVLIGSLTPSPTVAQRLGGLISALSATPIPTQGTGQLSAALWAKVLYNAALNPLGALQGVSYGTLGESPHGRAIMDEVVNEAFKVAHASGVNLPWQSAAQYLSEFYEKLIPATAGHRSSMLQDLERGRPTEIDAINGQVVTRGKALGIPTPVNATLCEMIRMRGYPAAHIR